MNTQEAYELLGLKAGSTEDEIKSAFRKQGAKLHPDVNKSPTAEADFKKLNEAYQFLNSPKTTTRFNNNNVRWSRVNVDFASFNSIRDMFEQTIWAKTAETEVINVPISFEESILGCEKDLKIAGNKPCNDCAGKGYVQKNTDVLCKKCEGNGYRTYGTEKQLPCTTCRGSGKEYELIGCFTCTGSGNVPGVQELRVRIGAGVHDGNIISINGVAVRINVAPHNNMIRSGINIISTLKIPLIDALKGIVKEVETIKGMKSLKIKGPRKHSDQVVAAGLGVPPYGNHIFLLDVEYPEDIDSLIKALEPEVKEKEEPHGI